MSFLLQIALDMGKESDNGGAFLQLALQFRNERQRFGVGVIEVEDDERRLFFAILQHPLGEVFVVFGELDFNVQLARGLLNLGGKEEIVNERKNARAGIFPQGGQRLGIGWRKRRGEAGTRPATRALAIIAVAGERSAIAVIHGSGVNAILIVARLAGAAGSSAACIVGAASATPSTSASSAGGSSRSCVHIPLKAALPGPVPVQHIQSSVVQDSLSIGCTRLDSVNHVHLVAAGSDNVGAPASLSCPSNAAPGWLCPFTQHIPLGIADWGNVIAAVTALSKANSY